MPSMVANAQSQWICFASVREGVAVSSQRDIPHLATMTSTTHLPLYCTGSGACSVGYPRKSYSGSYFTKIKLLMKKLTIFCKWHFGSSTCAVWWAEDENVHCPIVEPGLRPLSHRGTWSTAIVPSWNLVYGHCPTVEPGLRPLSHCGTWSTATQGTYKCKTRAYADVAHAQCVCSTSDEMNDAQLIVSVTRDCAFARTWQQASKSLGVPAYYGVRQAFCAVL